MESQQLFSGDVPCFCVTSSTGSLLVPLSPVPELMHRSHGEMATGSLGDGDLLYSPLIIFQGHCLPRGLLTTAVWHVTEFSPLFYSCTQCCWNRTVLCTLNERRTFGWTLGKDEASVGCQESNRSTLGNKFFS